MILHFKHSRRQTWILSFTRRFWRSSIVLVMKKHCRRSSDQIICHLSQCESIWAMYSLVFFSMFTYSWSITGRFIKLPTSHVCHVFSPLTCAAKGAEWADSFGGPQQTRCRNHVLLDRLEFLKGIVIVGLLLKLTFKLWYSIAALAASSHIFVAFRVPWRSHFRNQGTEIEGQPARVKLLVSELRNVKSCEVTKMHEDREQILERC